MVSEARRLVPQNRDGDKIEVVHADAFEYLPPEPVDVVICEMIHVAMLRERQIEVIETFKRRYVERFGCALPVFVPEAVIMAVQPVQESYTFHGFHAPVVKFQQTDAAWGRALDLGQPHVYSILDFNEPNALDVQWTGEFEIEHDGLLNALRFITKSVLAVLQQKSSTIDWLNHYMSLPLEIPREVRKGDLLQVSFA